MPDWGSLLTWEPPSDIRNKKFKFGGNNETTHRGSLVDKILQDDYLDIGQNLETMP